MVISRIVFLAVLAFSTPTEGQQGDFFESILNMVAQCPQADNCAVLQYKMKNCKTCDVTCTFEVHSKRLDGYVCESQSYCPCPGDEGFESSSGTEATGSETTTVQSAETTPTAPDPFESVSFDPVRFRWSQVGQPIDGDSWEGHLGGESEAVALSADGKIVAAGAPYGSDEDGVARGYVRVLEYDQGTKTWAQLGDTIWGDSADDMFGYSVSLSEDGTKVAVGAIGYTLGYGQVGMVRVLKYNRAVNKWFPGGKYVTGEQPGERMGFSTALSANGSMLVAGAAGSENGGVPGRVRLLKYDRKSDEWRDYLVQGDLKKMASGLGHGVALSEGVAGSPTLILAAGTQWQTTRLFMYNSLTKRWHQLGDEVGGSDGSFAISANGQVVVSGYPEDLGNTGQVEISRYNGISNQWFPLGQVLTGAAEGDKFGHAVAVSSDGTIVAIGSCSSDANGPDTGTVQVYHLDDETGEWRELDKGLHGTVKGDEFGYSVALSNSGTVLAASSRFNDGVSGRYGGQVRIFA